MCNRYTIKTSLSQLAAFYKADLFGDFPATEIADVEIFPRSIAPGLVQNADGDRELHPMQFAFAPPGCPTPSDPKRALNNARIESVDRWPWKHAIQKNRCVLPLTAFREPAYWGETEGTEIRFQRPDEGLLHVAGIYRIWKSPDHRTSLHTMSFLMRPASTYIMDHGHHRQPLFIAATGIDAWINPIDYTIEELKELLRTHAESPELIYHHARDMAASWIKRKSAKLKERDKQLTELESLENDVPF